MKSRHVLICFFLFALPLSLAQAAHAPKTPAVARTAAAAFQALEAGKFAAARSAATRLLNDRGYGDLGLWISALADLNEAAKSSAQARKLGEHAFEQAARIEIRFPYSTLVHEAPRLLGLAELIQGDALVAEKALAKARRAYESGFQRLSVAGFLSFAPRSSFAGYNKACATAKASAEAALCTAWIQRLAAIYPKRSPEFEAVTAGHEADLETARAARGAAGPRMTQTYRAPDLDLAAFDAAFERYTEKKWKDAIEGFEKFQTDFPKSAYRYRARYWWAKALAQKGDQDKSRQAYLALSQEAPMTYYGLVAAAAVNAPLLPSNAAPQEATRDSQLQPPDLLRLSRAEALLAAGSKSAAALDLRGIPAREAFSSAFLMYMADLQTQVGNHAQSFLFLSELFQRRYDNLFSSTVLPMIFPARLYDTVKRIAQEEKVDPLLALSLIKQESGFDPQALSNSGAIGMSQLMHATALDVDPKLERAQLTDVQRNLHIGIRYLGRLITRFKGNAILALAAYNAGPGAVDRWVRDLLQDRGWPEFVELIPYKESREYVTSILRNYYWYNRILDSTGTAAPVNFDTLWVQPQPKGGVPSPEPGPTE